MYLSFNPGIGSYTTIHVPEVGDAHLRFTASFPSRDALEQARREGVRVEMWTNLPVGDNHGDWHAVPFAYPDAESVEQSASLALAPIVPASPGTGRDVYLDIVLPSSLCGARYSFTYRLVRSWGAVEWLGAWGQNGDLVLERLEERFALAEGCSLKEGVVVREGGAVESAPVIRLKEPSNWTSWSFDNGGWASYSPSAGVPASKAVLLIPRLAEEFPTRGIPQPVFVCTGSEPSSTVIVSAEGVVSAQHSNTLTILDTGAASFIDQVRSKLPSFEITTKDGFAIFKSQVAEGTAPVSVSVVPLACAAARKSTRLTYDDLLSECPHISKEKTVLVDIAQVAFITIPSEPTDVSVEIGPYGGNFILSPLHVLEQASEELPWNLAVLSPSSFARIATETSGEELARLLPTPPPSPPPTSVSLSSSSSFPASASRSGGAGMSIALPSIAEVVAKEMEQTAPPTPVSPPAQPEHLSEEPESKPEDSTKPEEINRQVTLPSSRSQPIRSGLLRFFFAWIFRSVIARVLGFFAPVARYWGLPGYWFYDGTHDKIDEKDDASQQEDDNQEADIKVELTPELSEEKPQLDHDAQVDDLAEDQDRDFLSTSGSFGPIASPSETTLADSDDDVPEKEHYIPSKLEVAPSMETVVQELEVLSPRVFVAPHAPPKPRFLADMNSNTVSLLVRAPHARRTISDLKIHLGGKPVAEGDAGYTCARVSDDVYLLGLQGPQDGGRLEVSID